MSCEPTKDHAKQQELLQKPLQDPCITHMEELPNEVLQKPLPFVEQVATNNDSLQLFNISLQMPPSEPLPSTINCEESLQEREVQFLSVLSAQDTECIDRNITDCLRKNDAPISLPIP